MQGEGGIQRACRGMKKRWDALFSKRPPGVECNICGWQGSRFGSDSWHPYTICPRCGSHVRHRLLVAAVMTLPSLGREAIAGGRRVLHIAPEALIGNLFKGCAAEYVTADAARDDVEMRMDMCDMRRIADGSFDLVVACDVLEHVPDDSSALRELHRVLSARGWAILTVPQKDNLPSKYEDPAVTAPEERRRVFGQEDHLRIYGDDFGGFLEGHGFSVTVVDERSFDPRTVERHVLFPPVLSDHPLATNHRRVYFARKGPA